MQSLLGVSRHALQILIDAGFVEPSHGARNDLRFTFREVVLLRTALRLRGSRIPPRRILKALSRIRDQLPDAAPLSGVRITAVGDAVAVTTGDAQWDAVSGQLLLDFEVADVKGEVTFLDNAPASLSARRKQAQDWYSLAEQLQATDPVGAEDVRCGGGFVRRRGRAVLRAGRPGRPAVAVAAAARVSASTGLTE